MLKPRSRTRCPLSRCCSARWEPIGPARRATRETREYPAAGGAPQSPATLENVLDFRGQGSVEVFRDADPAFPSAGLARLRRPVERHELGERLACLGQNDFLTVRRAINEPRERSFRLVQVVDDLGHRSTPKVDQP